jgi:hypothetical protein
MTAGTVFFAGITGFLAAYWLFAGWWDRRCDRDAQRRIVRLTERNVEDWFALQLEEIRNLPEVIA